MKIPSKFSLALLAGTILSTPANYAAAATLTPTLDTIKAEAADLSGNFALSKLDGDLQEGAVEVEIAGVKYYFTPEGEDAALLKTLAGTVAGNLKEDENGIFEFDGKKYSFNTEAIPESVFEYAAGTAEDYNFTIEEADAEGNLTTKYYKVVLKPETFTTSESIKWSTTAAVETPGMTDSDLSDDNQVKGVVKIDLPNNKSEYYEYTYTKPAGYTDAVGCIDDTLATANVTNVVFSGISSSFGGAIYNTQDNGDINITADFIGNDGGAIYNGNATIGDITGDFIGNDGGAIDNYGTIGDITGDFIGNDGRAIYNFNGTIGNIIGDFIGNYTSGSVFDGVIYNSNGTIGDITGDFIGNYTNGSGAIYNVSATIGDITGDFIGNHTNGSGAIFNYYEATIGDITGDFIGNYAQYGDGGAIFNGGTIGNITGDFIGNYAQNKSTGAYASGGAIYNSGTIGDITGDFIGNYAISTRDDASGGAIYNDGTIGDITGDFIGNYAQSENDQALGGAIYNS